MQYASIGALKISCIGVLTLSLGKRQIVYEKTGSALELVET